MVACLSCSCQTVRKLVVKRCRCVESCTDVVVGPCGTCNGCLLEGERAFGQVIYNTTKVTDTDQIITQDDTLEIPQLTGFFPRTDSNLPLYAQRLQKLLRGIRRTFGAGSWQIDWLDDGEICWVTKVAVLQSGKVAK